MKAHLQADKAGEEATAKTYGKRKAQHPTLAPMYNEMQDDEQDHTKKLSAALKGLKSAHAK